MIFFFFFSSFSFYLKITSFYFPPSHLQSGLEKSIESAIAEGDYGKAEELSDRLATREVCCPDKPSRGALQLWQIELMGLRPFFLQRHRGYKHSHVHTHTSFDLGRKSCNPFTLKLMESPPPVWSTAVSIELSVLPFNEGYNAFNPSAKTFSRCQFYTFEVSSYLNTVPAVLKRHILGVYVGSSASKLIWQKM